MKIHVPFWAQSRFWNEPPPDSMEFWATRFEPKCKLGDKIEFFFKHGNGAGEDGWRKVAEAVVDHTGPPRESRCEHSGRFWNLWKVFWRQETFKDMRNQKSNSKYQKCG